MTESFANLILSDLFTFHVGTAEKRDTVQVHSRAIAATCDYMRALIEGGLKEAQERCADLDMELDDFVRFVEYAYRGDYTAPTPMTEESSKQDEADLEAVKDRTRDSPIADAEEDDGWGSWNAAAPVKKYKKKKSSRMVDSFAEPVAPDEPYPVQPDKSEVFRTMFFNQHSYLQDGGPKADILKGFDPVANRAANQNFTPVFLAYAHLYSFAQMRLIHGLKALTLDKLHRTLQKFKLYPERIGDIIHLAEYAYDSNNENTPSRKADGTVDELRKLIVDYIVCEKGKIGKSREFRELLEQGGEFVSDFWDVMNDHII